MGLALNGALVHNRRVAAGLSARALADRVGVHTDVIWAIEEGDAHRLEHLSVVTLVSLADSLDLHPGQLFVEADVPPPVPPMPDDVMLEAALLELGTSVTCQDLAAAFGWPLARIDRALAALRQRLASSGARLRPVGLDRYALTPNRRALTSDQWVQLGQSHSGHAPLTLEAATALYQIIVLHARPSPTSHRRHSHVPNVWRTDEWDDADEGLRQLRAEGLLDGDGPNFAPSRDVCYSLGLDGDPTAILVTRNENDSALPLSFRVTPGRRQTATQGAEQGMYDNSTSRTFILWRLRLSCST